MELDGKLCDEVVTERKLTYVGYGVFADGGCEAVVTARTSCMLSKFRECGRLLYGMIFHLWILGPIYKSYVMSANLYGSEVWYLKVSEIGIL